MFTLILLSGCEQPTQVGDEVDELDYIFRNDLGCFNAKYEYIKGLYK